jgi:hypothetical protein
MQMRKTHLERFKESPVWTAFHEGFRIIKTIDRDKEFVPETLFDRVFTPEFVARAMGNPVHLHETRLQRKLDTSVAQHLYHLWADGNYFDISPRLCNKLLDTDLKDIDTYFLKTPFRSMYLSLPQGNGMYLHNDQTGKHEVKGIYVLFQDFGQPETIAFRTVGNKIEGVLKYLHILAVGEEVQEWDDTLVFFHLLFWEGKISESIEKSKALLPPDPTLWPSIEEIFGFVTKVLLYLNCANVSIQKVAGFDLDGKVAGLKNKTKKRKLQHRYEKLSTKPHNLLDIVVDHRSGVGAEPASKGSSGLLGPKALERVRGYFRMQHFGKGSLESKVIWIEPYIRGSDAEYFREERRYKLV